MKGAQQAGCTEPRSGPQTEVTLSPVAKNTIPVQRLTELSEFMNGSEELLRRPHSFL
jgi:hypothetical protein